MSWWLYLLIGFIVLYVLTILQCSLDIFIVARYHPLTMAFWIWWDDIKYNVPGATKRKIKELKEQIIEWNDGREVVGGEIMADGRCWRYKDIFESDEIATEAANAFYPSSPLVFWAITFLVPLLWPLVLAAVVISGIYIFSLLLFKASNRKRD